MLVHGLQIALLVYQLEKVGEKMCYLDLRECLCDKFGDVFQIFLSKKFMVYYCEFEGKTIR